MRIKKAVPLCMLALTVLVAGFTGPERVAEHPLAGDWDYTLETPQGTYEGTLVFTETEDGLSGTMESADQSGETPLQNVTFEGSTLSFSAESPEAGTMKVKVEVDGDAFDGMMELPMYGLSMPFKGSRTSAPEAETSEADETETAEADQSEAETSEADESKTEMAETETAEKETAETLSTDNTLRTLLASEEAKAVLEKHIPEVLSHPEVGQAMDMTLPEIAQYAPDELSKDVLEAINTDLQQIGKSAEGQAEDEGQAEAVEEGSKGLSTDNSLRDLMADEEAKAVLQKHIPEVITHPDISQAMDMTLPEIAQYAPDALSQDVLDAINKDLAKL